MPGVRTSAHSWQTPDRVSFIHEFIKQSFNLKFYIITFHLSGNILLKKLFSKYIASTVYPPPILKIIFVAEVRTIYKNLYITAK